MSNLALYRKYRSQDFEAVIGQPHIVATLQSAIASNRISHAYLFTGPRGVGKTTVARLLAKSLNCTGSTRPCGKCANCQVELGSHLDLIEIDAASNRRIDEIRELRDKIGLAPALGKYKVYIIDEVHMLTNEAFNALLKTLEEPPSHAVFILATTEAHKLPETIISRTQRFNFKPLSRQDLVQGLAAIAAAEKIKIDEAALSLVATASRGGFRDAISMLDQLASSGGPIEAATVRLVLGWGDAESIDHLAVAISKNQPIEALAALDRAISQGAQVGQIISQLIERWREVLLLNVGAIQPVGGDDISRSLAESCDSGRIIGIIEQLAAAAKSSLPQLAIETSIVKLTANDKPASPLAPPAPAASAAAIPTSNQPQPTPEAAPTASDNERWLKALSLIKQRNNSLYALLRSCTTAITNDQLTLTCRFNFHRDRLEESKNRQIIEQALDQSYGTKLRVVCQLQAEPATPNDPANELVSSALEILGGEVVDG